MFDLGHIHFWSAPLFPRRQSEDGQACLHHPNVPARVAEHLADVRLATTEAERRPNTPQLCCGVFD